MWPLTCTTFLKSTIILFWKNAHVFQHFFSLKFLDNFQDTGCNVFVLNFGKANLSASTVLVTQRQFSVLFACENILILVIYWKKTGLLYNKISNHNIIYSSQKPRKSSSLPLKSTSWLFSLDAGTGIYKCGNNTYPRHIRHRSNLGHFFGEKMRLMGRDIRYML